MNTNTAEANTENESNTTTVAQSTRSVGRPKSDSSACNKAREIMASLPKDQLKRNIVIPMIVDVTGVTAGSAQVYFYTYRKEFLKPEDTSSSDATSNDADAG